jgi:hypothetical protein
MKFTCTYYKDSNSAELCGNPAVAIIFEDFRDTISPVCAKHAEYNFSGEGGEAIPITCILEAADKIRASGWKMPRGRNA